MLACVIFPWLACGWALCHVLALSGLVVYLGRALRELTLVASNWLPD